MVRLPHFSILKRENRSQQIGIARKAALNQQQNPHEKTLELGGGGGAFSGGVQERDDRDVVLGEAAAAAASSYCGGVTIIAGRANFGCGGGSGSGGGIDVDGNGKLKTLNWNVIHSVDQRRHQLQQ